MWKRLWKTWTVDRPAAFGDWLWDVFVVEFAAFLDRLTLRQVIVFISLLILIVAYSHRIPLPPELIFVGDLLAYIDIFSMIFLLSVLGRVATILYVLRQAAKHVRGLVSHAFMRPGRPRRVRDARTGRRLTGRAKSEDDGRVPVCGLAWA
jgi:hypothetical protein